jgi:hypothetical protein
MFDLFCCCMLTEPDQNQLTLLLHFLNYREVKACDLTYICDLSNNEECSEPIAEVQVQND